MTPLFRCTRCLGAWGCARWECPHCGTKNTLFSVPGEFYHPPGFSRSPTIRDLDGEQLDYSPRDDTASKTARLAELCPRLIDLDATPKPRITTGIEVYDRLLGGQARPGAPFPNVVMFAGQPGSGKSTSARVLLASILESTREVGLYVSAEEALDESARQCVDTKRLNLVERFPHGTPLMRVVETQDWDDALEAIEIAEAQHVVFDSIANLKVNRGDGSPFGKMSKIEWFGAHIAQRTYARDAYRHLPPLKTVFVIAHATKSGDISGPLAAEHHVDHVCVFENWDVSINKRCRKSMGVTRLSQKKNRNAAAHDDFFFRLDSSGLTHIELDLDDS